MGSRLGGAMPGVRWYRRGGWALALALAMAGLQLFTGLVDSLDQKLLDAATTRASRQPLSEIAIVAIDEASLAAIGPWPWPRDVYAQLIDRLAAAGARTIVLASEFESPQSDRGLVYLRQIRSMLVTAPPEAQALSAFITRTVNEAEAALDTDRRFASSIQRAGNVLLAARMQVGMVGDPAAVRLPASMNRSAMGQPVEALLPAQGLVPPLESLGQVAAGVGHMATVADADGVVRKAPLLLQADGAAVPALGLLAAAHSLHLGASGVRWLPAQGVQMGSMVVPTDRSALLRTQPYPLAEGGAAFRVWSFNEVLLGKVSPTQINNRIVLVGVTAAGLFPPAAAPGGTTLAPVQFLAEQVSSIRQGHIYTDPAWSPGLAWAGLVAATLFLAFAAPMLGTAGGAVASLALAAGLLVLEWVWLQQAGQWLHLVLPACMLLAGGLLCAVQAARAPRAVHGAAAADTEADRMMGLALQGQGQLDMAFERLRRVRAGPQAQSDLLNLAHEFEQKHRYERAVAVYEHILRQNRSHPEARNRRKRARHLAQVAEKAGAPLSESGPAAASMHPSVLGRYRIEKELGRGAMGVVYQGRDPKIGRVVAIKALALGQEFDGAALVDARERFFREAESAGRLQHQNIVTIYDAGEDQGLAWIAMELLKGQDLSAATRPEHLLPVPQVVAIAAQVADALDYAHQQNVVHRDIKPANIMFDLQTGSVKVSDFGIARITDSSKTRTGLVLGTPSFMSPEQLAGHRVDGRCDLYALGVTLFQLLTGSLPLRGDSMSQLMHNIAHVPAPDVRTLRPEIPQALAQVVAQALRKNPQDRYQTGRQFAAALRGVHATLDGGMNAMGGQSAQALDYDARNVPQEHNMPDFQETVMDIPVARVPASNPGKGTP